MNGPFAFDRSRRNEAAPGKNPVAHANLLRGEYSLYRGLSPEMGPMSTSVRGDADDIFAALRDGFIRAAADGPQVMTLTVSSGCPEES